MAHRLFLKDLDSRMVTTRALKQTMHEVGMNYVETTDIRIWRSSNPATGTVPWCSAFITLRSREHVEEAVNHLHKPLRTTLSSRLIFAEVAVPRLDRATKDPYLIEEDTGKDSTSHCSTEADLGNDSTNVTEETSHADRAVFKMLEVKKEEKKSKALPQAPWQRRAKLRESKGPLP